MFEDPSRSKTMGRARDIGAPGNVNDWWSCEQAGIPQGGAQKSISGQRHINGLDHVLASYTSENDKYDIENFSYDANGNTTKRTLYTAAGIKETVFTYDTLNRLITTAENGKQVSYAYDNAGNRLYKSDANGMTLYIRHGQIAVAMDIEVYSPSSPEFATKRGTVNRYVLSGDLLAGRVTTTVKPDGSKTFAKSYYHLDHLNSTKVVTDQSGVAEVRYIYRAFGEQLRKLGSGDATYTYGGKELDEATNLYYFNARYYDATTGRFINVDPIQDGSNWYIYCSNNPLSFVDPTGLEGLNSFGYSVASRESAPPSKDTEFANLMRGLVGTKYVLGGLSSEGTDCSGSVIVSLTKMGYKIPDTTANQMATGGASWIKIKDSVDNSIQGNDGVLNFYKWAGEEKVGHVNVGVGTRSGEKNSQVVDATDTFGPNDYDWTASANRSGPNTKAGQINKTYAPFSTKTSPTIQGTIDWEELDRNYKDTPTSAVEHKDHNNRED